MKIINQSNPELTKVQLYKMTMDQSIEKMSNAPECELTCFEWVIFEDHNKKENKDVEILSILTECGVFATNSETFKIDFMNIVSLFEDSEDKQFIFKKIKGISKSGREFITLSLL